MVGVGSTSMVSRVNGGHCFEAQESVLALGEQPIAELLQNEREEVDVIHLARARLAACSSVIGLLCSGCVTVLSRG